MFYKEIQNQDERINDLEISFCNWKNISPVWTQILLSSKKLQPIFSLIIRPQNIIITQFDHSKWFYFWYLCSHSIHIF